MDCTTTGFGEGIVSWVPTTEGVTILATDATNPTLSVRLVITREQMAQWIAHSLRAYHGERMMPRSIDTN